MIFSLGSSSMFKNMRPPSYTLYWCILIDADDPAQSSPILNILLLLFYIHTHTHTHTHMLSSFQMTREEWTPNNSQNSMATSRLYRRWKPKQDHDSSMSTSTSCTRTGKERRLLSPAE